MQEVHANSGQVGECAMSETPFKQRKRGECQYAARSGERVAYRLIW